MVWDKGIRRDRKECYLRQNGERENPLRVRTRDLSESKSYNINGKTIPGREQLNNTPRPK